MSKQTALERLTKTQIQRNKYKAQRDELLEALEGLLAMTKVYNCLDHEETDKARTILAKVKGEDT